MTTALGGYLDDIVSACGCTNEQAPAVEELMRLGTSNGCLDHLSGPAFKDSARISRAALTELVAEGDPYWTERVRA